MGCPNAYTKSPDSTVYFIYDLRPIRKPVTDRGDTVRPFLSNTVNPENSPHDIVKKQRR